MGKQLFSDFRRLVKSDLKRYRKSFWYAVLMIPGFKYTFHHRLCYYLSQYKALFPLYALEFLRFRYLTFHLGIEVFRGMNLPEGFCISHFGGITFYPQRCGKNVFLRPGVVVGTAGSFDFSNNPIIGNNVTFGVHSCVLGGVEIGDNVVIAAGAVVVKDVPANCVVAGVPAKVVKYISKEETKPNNSDE